jgi:nucleotide-binding universal stress UspA family protein
MYNKILVPIDTDHESAWTCSLPVASELAREFGARIHAMTVVPDYLLQGFYPNLASPEVKRITENKLVEIVKDNVPTDVSVTTSVESGGIYAEILRLAHALPADLIVMASHRPVIKDYLLGSNAGHIVLHAPCSVFVVRKQEVDEEALAAA